MKIGAKALFSIIPANETNYNLGGAISAKISKSTGLGILHEKQKEIFLPPQRTALREGSKQPADRIRQGSIEQFAQGICGDIAQNRGQ